MILLHVGVHPHVHETDVAIVFLACLAILVWSAYKALRARG